jgi:hypothetical protein
MVMVMASSTRLRRPITRGSAASLLRCKGGPKCRSRRSNDRELRAARATNSALKVQERKLLDLYYADKIDSEGIGDQARHLATQRATLQSEMDEMARTSLGAELPSNNSITRQRCSLSWTLIRCLNRDGTDLPPYIGS